ncbi:ABC transporter ATP-binding protein [Herbaspirillum sp. RTI4]|uniref:ABC transporter ATP-binding protein n=1 Tax=Herbaspirillum sp. RTI4 TaxID=3048640 RepID=UPI003A0FE3B2
MPPALELIDVRKRYGGTDILCGVNLCIPQGQRCVIIGPNGAGKSSLFNLISGRHAPDAGDIRLHGKSISGLRPYRISRMGLARSFQLSHIFSHLSVFENLQCAVLAQRGDRYAFWRGANSILPVQKKVREVLGQLGLQDRQAVLASALTYAEQRMLELGMTLAAEAQVLLLDEPTAGMDGAEAMRMVELIRQVSTGRTLLMIEHDMDVVRELADHIAVLVDGRIIASDTPQRIVDNPLVRRLYLDAAGPVRD